MARIILIELGDQFNDITDVIRFLEGYSFEIINFDYNDEVIAKIELDIDHDLAVWFNVIEYNSITILEVGSIELVDNVTFYDDISIYYAEMHTNDQNVNSSMLGHIIEYESDVANDNKENKIITTVALEPAEYYKNMKGERLQ